MGGTLVDYKLGSNYEYKWFLYLSVMIIDEKVTKVERGDRKGDIKTIKGLVV